MICMCIYLISSISSELSFSPSLHALLSVTLTLSLVHLFCLPNIFSSFAGRVDVIVSGACFYYTRDCETCLSNLPISQYGFFFLYLKRIQVCIGIMIAVGQCYIYISSNVRNKFPTFSI